MNEVSKWLSAGAEVREGLRLLQVYRPNKYLETLVTRRPDKFKQLLVKSLSEFADELPAARPAVPRRNPGSFRREWPFLSEPDCPMELKVLAADKITAWQNYCELHEKLYDCTTVDDCFETAKNLLENFRQNRKILSEFTYYLEHHSLLGEHPIFKQRKRLEHYHKMGIYKLAQEQRRLNGAIWRVKSEIAKGDKPHLLTEREERLREKENELAMVNELISEYSEK